MAVTRRFSFDGKEMREEVVHKGGVGIHTAGQNAETAEKQKSAENAVKSADAGDIRMLVSSLLKKDGKQYARVSFLRGEDVAEGIVPDGTLEQVRGFTEEEAAGLKFYLTANQEAILAQAKKIDPLTSWLREPEKSK